jgi:hypothetical protein
MFSSTANANKGTEPVCLWPVPKKQMWINLYTLQTISINKATGNWDLYENVTVISLGAFAVTVDIPKTEPIDVHVQSIFKRIAECKNLNSK